MVKLIHSGIGIRPELSNFCHHITHTTKNSATIQTELCVFHSDFAQHFLTTVLVGNFPNASRHVILQRQQVRFVSVKAERPTIHHVIMPGRGGGQPVGGVVGA